MPQERAAGPTGMRGPTGGVYESYVLYDQQAGVHSEAAEGEPAVDLGFGIGASSFTTYGSVIQYREGNAAQAVLVEGKACPICAGWARI